MFRPVPVVFVKSRLKESVSPGFTEMPVYFVDISRPFAANAVAEKAAERIAAAASVFKNLVVFFIMKFPPF